MSNIGYRIAVAVLVAGVVGGFGSGIRSMKHHRDHWRSEGGCHSQHHGRAAVAVDDKKPDEKQPDEKKPNEKQPAE